jgi:hypothetical protein
MGQSIGSVGNSHKQAGAGDQKANQPSVRPGQRVSDEQTPVPHKGVPNKGKPDGGADHGPRSAR